MIKSKITKKVSTSDNKLNINTPIPSSRNIAQRLGILVNFRIGSSNWMFCQISLKELPIHELEALLTEFEILSYLKFCRDIYITFPIVLGKDV